MVDQATDMNHYRSPASPPKGRRPAIHHRPQQLEEPTYGPDGRPRVRTIPAWVQDCTESDLEDLDLDQLDEPERALVSQKIQNISTTRRSDNGKQREGYPVSSGKRRDEPTSRWISFARSSAYPREAPTADVVTVEWLNENWTDYSKPWLAGHNEDDIEDGSSRYHAFRKKRQTWHKRAQFTILRNPFIPLVFRFIVIAFALCALGLGASIYRKTNAVRRRLGRNPDPSEGPVYDDPSAMMAIIVDTIAVVYSVYITYDEYFSKPLGLRKARAKIRLVLLDLFFIVFQAANLSLSFNSLELREGVCRSVEGSPRYSDICHRGKALAAVLIISLVAWMMTFCVSVLRLVERINTR